MHLAEGIISSPVILGGGALLACGGVALGLHKLDEPQALRTAVLSSGFFVASMIHIPFFGVSIHLTLGGLLGIVLGWAAFPAILVGLLLQLTLFGFGGLTTLGLNVCIMAFPAVIAHAGSRILLRRPGSGYIIWGSGILGAATTAMSAIVLAAILRTGGDPFVPMASAILLAHIPVMVLEGCVTAAAVRFLLRASPELLVGDQRSGNLPLEKEHVSCD